MHAVIAEIFAHRAAGVRRKELERRRLGRSRGDHDRIFHRAIFLERADDLGDGRALLADGDIDAVELLALFAALVDFLLVDEGVERDGGLAGLAIADDQLALAAANGNERVKRLEPGLYRFVHGLAWDDAGRLHLHPATLRRVDRALAVNGVAKAIHDPSQEPLANRHVDDRAGPLDGRTFLDLRIGAEDDDANVVGLEIE